MEDTEVHPEATGRLAGDDGGASGAGSGACTCHHASICMHRIVVTTLQGEEQNFKQFCQHAITILLLWCSTRDKDGGRLTHKSSFVSQDKGIKDHIQD